MMLRVKTRYLFALGAVALLTLAALPVAAQGPPARIAVVDIETIVTRSSAGKELQAQMEGFRQQAESELRVKADALQALEQRIAAATDAAERESLAKQYEQEGISLQRLRDDKQREGQKLQQDGLERLERELTPIFDQLRDQDGWDLILARTPGVTLIVSDRIDLTQRVLELFDAAGDQ